MTTARRARNEISRRKELKLRAAELYDDGATHGDVAKALSKEFAEQLGGKKLSAKTARSFYLAEYRRVEEERLLRRETAKDVDLILGAARGSGIDVAEAVQDMLARFFFDVMKDPAKRDQADLESMGKSVAKIIELNNDRMKIQQQAEKIRMASEVKEAVADKSLTPDQLVARVDELMGIRKKS